jgi:hypothetical protein
MGTGSMAGEIRKTKRRNYRSPSDGERLKKKAPNSFGAFFICIV